MQTFLPLPDFYMSAACLDNKRLGKQRVEARQILDALRGHGSERWRNHPAVKMWVGYEEALTSYANIMIREWISRGFSNTMPIDATYTISRIEMPPWFGNEKFHGSHQSNLLRKYPEHYEQFGWDVPDDLPYVWPSKEGMM
jgi:hypothetical protein